MNDYRIIYSTAEGNAQETITERSEAAARKFFKARHKDAEISDVELVNVDVNATKAQERETLEKIKTMVAELGPQSYLKTAFEGVFEVAEMNMRQGVNAYGYKIKATHLELRTESKRKEKRKVKAMIAKLREGKKTRREIQQEVNSWLGFARWASAYNLAKKIFAPYRFIKVEGVLPYGAISRNRAARRVLQQWHNPQAAHKAVAA